MRLLFLFFLLLAAPLSAQQLSLTWTDTSGQPCGGDPLANCQEDEFIVQRCQGDVTSCQAGPFSEIARPPQNAEAYTDTGGLVDGQAYTYRVAAENSQGVSPWSNLASAVAVAPSPPDTLLVLTCNQVTVTSLLDENFESYAIGGNPTDWRDTQAGNSFVIDDSLLTVQSAGGSKAAVITNTGVNIHSHYVGAGSQSWANYTFTGRMRISGNGGIGVTFLSRFPQNQDHYYRLRRMASVPTFRIDPHGTTVSGDVESGVNPALNTWYRFRIVMQDTGTQTMIKANIWPDGQAEPAGWQIDAMDTSATRLTAGTVGVWSWATGQNVWDELRVE